MRIFKNKKTGKRYKLDELIYSELIERLEKNNEFKELIMT